MKLQASHHGRDGRHQAPPAVQTWSYRLDKAASYDSNLGNAELDGRGERPAHRLRRRAPEQQVLVGFVVDAVEVRTANDGAGVEERHALLPGDLAIALADEPRFLCP